MPAVALVILPALAGCQQFQQIFRTPGEPGTARQSVVRPYRLAGYAPAAEEHVGGGSAVGSDAPTAPAAVAAEDVATNGAALGYTAPQFALPQLIALTGQFSRSRTLTEANVAGVTGDALVTGPAGILGRAGLSGSTATLGTTLVSRPGLQDGPATGLGFATPGRNVFSRQPNPFSGPGGGCEILTRAGFFGGDRGACERAVRR